MISRRTTTASTVVAALLVVARLTVVAATDGNGCSYLALLFDEDSEGNALNTRGNTQVVDATKSYFPCCPSPDAASCPPGTRLCPTCCPPGASCPSGTPSCPSDPIPGLRGSSLEVADNGHVARVALAKPPKVTVSGKSGERIGVYDSGGAGGAEDPTNVLIVQDPSITTHPKEDEGWIVFDFECPIEFDDMYFADTEKFPLVDFYFSDGSPKLRLQGPKTSDSEDWSPGEVDSVIRIEVNMRESGGVSSLFYCQRPCAS